MLYIGRENSVSAAPAPGTHSSIRLARTPFVCSAPPASPYLPRAYLFKCPERNSRSDRSADTAQQIFFFSRSFSPSRFFSGLASDRISFDAHRQERLPGDEASASAPRMRPRTCPVPSCRSSNRLPEQVRPVRGSYAARQDSVRIGTLPAGSWKWTRLRPAMPPGKQEPLVPNRIRRQTQRQKQEQRNQTAFGCECIMRLYEGGRV